MPEAQRLLILGVASLAASAISACFSVGGGYILFGAISAIRTAAPSMPMNRRRSFDGRCSKGNCRTRPGVRAAMVSILSQPA